MVQLPTLDGIDLLGTIWSGFAYPQNAQIVTLLSDGVTPGGNAVMQSSALTFRQATISFKLEADADVAALRAIAATHEEVTFVDYSGASAQVRVLELSASMAGHELWDCAASLVEVPGS